MARTLQVAGRTEVIVPSRTFTIRDSVGNRVTSDYYTLRLTGKTDTVVVLDGPLVGTVNW